MGVAVSKAICFTWVEYDNVGGLVVTLSRLRPRANALVASFVRSVRAECAIRFATGTERFLAVTLSTMEKRQ